MLLELEIKDLAIFATARADLATGLVVVSGETGSGKSVFLSALRLLQGGRADGDLVRRGAERAVISARFQLPPDPGLASILEELGSESDDGELLMVREIQPQGRSRVRIGGATCSLKDLAKVSRRLFDLHGQHAEQRLFQEANHASLLTAYAGAADVLQAYRAQWQLWRKLTEQAKETRERAADLARQREFLEFQHRELEEAHLRAGEEEELERRISLASQSGNLAEGVAQVRQILSEDGALERGLSQLSKAIAKLSTADSQLESWSVELDAARSHLREITARADGYDPPGDIDPAEIDRLNARLSKLQRLKARHRTDAAGLLALRERTALDLRTLEDGGADAQRLETQAMEAKAKASNQAKDLARRQETASKQLAKDVTDRLQGLGMMGASFRARLEELEELSRDGSRRVVFELCPNPGEGWRDLAEVASGGEASRIMLAIEGCLAALDPVPLLVFDEVDAGLGGTAAKSVGKALRELAAHRQVIAISHLHQVAASADHHIAISKHTSDGRTHSEVRVLSADQRREELARMLGDPNDPAVLAHATSLLAREGEE